MRTTITVSIEDNDNVTVSYEVESVDGSVREYVHNFTPRSFFDFADAIDTTRTMLVDRMVFG